MAGPGLSRWCQRNVDVFVIALGLAAGVAWICFVVAFSREANNPDRPSDVDGIEHFMWYAFALMAALAITLMLLHVARKKITGLTLALVTTSITLLMAGAPANDSGHFLWRCSKEDYEPPGCQEASYDNHAMIFSSVLIYVACMTTVVAVTPLMPTTERFTLKGGADINEPFL